MMSHYGAAKSAVITLTRELAMAWGRKGVRVNCIAPGPIVTEGYVDVLKKGGPEGEKAYKDTAERVGIGRWGEVHEIAYPAVFLASDAASFIQGETIVIDGGPAAREAEG
jgi:NAD(P)-dependent dehydrogenase (short-subunit alcohol dehydrogenase family)